jgi:DNA-binding GntR family transcriptional regulator
MRETALEKLEAALARETRGGHDPKYLQVFTVFTDAIRRGDFKPGQRLPAEAELCAHLPVSLGTVQKAMSRLVATGLVVRNRRTGTFVADRKSQASEAFVFRFKHPKTGAPQMPFVRVLAVEEDRSRGPWRTLLDVERCVRLDRLLWIEHDPPAFTSVYFSYDHGKVLLDTPLEELHGSSTHRVMADRFNLPTLRVEHRIGARALSAVACKRLMLDPGTIGTVWDVSDFSIGDRPILFQRLQLPPDHRPIELAEGSSVLTAPPMRTPASRRT